MGHNFFDGLGIHIAVELSAEEIGRGQQFFHILQTEHVRLTPVPIDGPEAVVHNGIPTGGGHGHTVEEHLICTVGVVELLFDQGIGDIFVIRTAGNNVNSEMVMGSVDYAIEHLGVKLLLVLGHGSCGGVTGAISEGEEEHGNIGKLLSAIRDDVSQYVGKTDSLEAAIHHHAHVQVERIVAYPHVSEKIENGELLVKRAYYDVNTGKITVF